jgi:rubrerythrin
MDCLRVARRLGVPKVRCVYRRSEAEAPARLEELRHAKEEGVEFLFLHGPVEIQVGDDGAVRGLRVEQMQLGEPDAKGRRKPVGTGQFVDLPCSTVIYALGTKANPIVPQATPGLGTNQWGYVQADPQLQTTTLPGVFAGGDIVTGGATVILAMGAGRRAARSIGAFLASGKRWPLTKADVDAWVPGAATPKSAALDATPVCPKCRRPVEPGDDGLCCAGQQLTWRCDDCGKVSEGFAFPWGLCPMCGGVLKMTTPTLAGEVGLEAIRTAFEVELGGLTFYRRAAAHATDDTMRALFEKFGAMERAHMATLARRYHVDPPAPDAAVPLDHAALYAGIPNDPGDPVNLFRLALALENKAVTFFSARVEATAAGTPARALYTELLAEEQEHVALLTTELARWRAGKPGLMSGVDVK